ncbi:MAG TPA: DUF2846 domain-containing protein [Thermoanaerobaculia bacterium]|jgi:hypothetical protein|nr:DUF2846 domain-containing protein [Thermoanaerobaculia bacterium]
MSIRIQRLVILASVLVLSSSATLVRCDPQEETSVKSQGNTATIYLYRPQRIGTYVLPLILVNGKEAAIFAPHRYVKINVEPGIVQIAMSVILPLPPFTVENLETFFREPRSITGHTEISAVAGQSYFVRWEAGEVPVPIIDDPVEGAKEVRRLTEIKCSFVPLRQMLAAMQKARDEGHKLTIDPLHRGFLQGGRTSVCQDQ